MGVVRHGEWHGESQLERNVRGETLGRCGDKQENTLFIYTSNNATGQVTVTDAY